MIGSLNTTRSQPPREKGDRMTAITNLLKRKADNGLLKSQSIEDARLRFGLSHAAVERLSLEASLLPSRYQRNGATITVAEQLKLFSSKVAVVGCGGLGGHVIEGLARLGIGKIIAIDPDVFEEHNLNRQILSTLPLIGESKALAAAKRISEINPAVTVTPAQVSFDTETGEDLLLGSAVVADAVDNVGTRFAIAAACAKLDIPLVHAAIAGWYGHVCTVFPGDTSLAQIYDDRCAETGIESDLGNPAFTPAVVAGFEVAEICKILLGKNNLLRHRQLTIDLLDMEVEEIHLAGGNPA